MRMVTLQKVGGFLGDQSKKILPFTQAAFRDRPVKIAKGCDDRYFPFKCLIRFRLDVVGV
jgi:hypothetical protein